MLVNLLDISIKGIVFATQLRNFIQKETQHIMFTCFNEMTVTLNKLFLKEMLPLLNWTENMLACQGHPIC